jgi:hypothetical protein
MAAPTLNHRRDRHEIRRILAQLVVQGRDLTASCSLWEHDIFDRHNRSPMNDNHQDVVATMDRGRA